MEGLNPAYRDFLESRRKEINKRVELAARRHRTSLHLEVVYEGFKKCFAHLFKVASVSSENGFEALFDSILDLFLVAVARRYYTGTGIVVNNPNMDALFDEIFPQYYEILIQEPARLPAILFNVCENLRKKSPRFLHFLGKSKTLITTSSLEEFVQIVIWILGDPRYRTRALEIIGNLKEKDLSAFLSTIFEREIPGNKIPDIKTTLNQYPLLPLELVLENHTGKLDNDSPPTMNVGVRYGKWRGFAGGKFDYPTRIAGIHEDKYLVLYTFRGKIHFLQMDGQGAWQSHISTPSAEQVILANSTMAYGIAKDRLINLITGDELSFRGNSKVHHAFHDGQFLYIIREKRGGNALLEKYCLDWDKNKWYPPTKKLNLIRPVPLFSMEIPSIPKSVYCPGKDVVYMNIYDGEEMLHKIYPVPLEKTKGELLKEPVFSAPLNFRFCSGSEYGYILIDSGILITTSLDFEEEIKRQTLPGILFPSSLIEFNSCLYFTCAMSHHVHAFFQSPLPDDLRLIKL